MYLNRYGAHVACYGMLLEYVPQCSTFSVNGFISCESWSMDVDPCTFLRNVTDRTTSDEVAITQDPLVCVRRRLEVPNLYRLLAIRRLMAIRTLFKNVSTYQKIHLDRSIFSRIFSIFCLSNSTLQYELVVPWSSWQNVWPTFKVRWSEDFFLTKKSDDHYILTEITLKGLWRVCDEYFHKKIWNSW